MVNKKWLFAVLIFMLFGLSLFADSFIGAAVRFDRSLTNGSAYNDAFADFSSESISIDDFSFGLAFSYEYYFYNETDDPSSKDDDNELDAVSTKRQQRAKKWKARIGIRLDVVAYYVPLQGYSSISDAISSSIDGLGETLTGSLGGLMATDATAEEEPSAFLAAFEDIDHAFEFELNPMLVIGRKFVRIYGGPGASFSWNLSQYKNSAAALESSDGDALNDAFAESGITGVSGVSDAASLKETLSWQQLIAFYGGELDFNIKAGIDFKLGKMVFGINYVWDMNIDLAQWSEGGEFKDNMNSIFQLENTTGKLAATLLFRL